MVVKDSTHPQAPMQQAAPKGPPVSPLHLNILDFAQRMSLTDDETKTKAEVVEG